MDIFSMLQNVETFFWGYIGFILIIVLGAVLTVKTAAFQVRALPFVFKSVRDDFTGNDEKEGGIHPVRVFFASVGGMLGVGNIVGIVTAVEMGGPGALFWVWIAGLFGTLIKYSEIYLGLRYRVRNKTGGFDGGPMYFLRQAFKVEWVSVLICVLLCIYGAEIYQFNVVVETVSSSWGIDRYVAGVGLLGFVLYAVLGGVRRVAHICSIIMPLFMVTYVVMCLSVIIFHVADLSAVLSSVVESAFTGQAAIGGFMGSTAMLAIQNGMASASYAADIGIGYDSIIQSESSVLKPERQARFALLGVIMDNLFCTLSIMVVLVTGLWHSGGGVQKALSQFFPFMDIVMPLFIFILGYTTLIAYLIVGVKCAKYLHPSQGAKLYLSYAVGAFIFFQFFDQGVALTVMRIAGALLLTINLTGIFLLRREISFAEGEKAYAAG